MFDTTAYIIAGEADLDPQLFSRIFQTEKVSLNNCTFLL